MVVVDEDTESDFAPPDSDVAAPFPLPSEDEDSELEGLALTPEGAPDFP